MTGSDRRVSAALLVALVAGVVAFAWPLFLRPESGISAAQAPILFALVLPLVLAIVLSELAGGRMDDAPGRLVEDEQVFVLEQDFERDFFGLRDGGRCGRPVDGNFFTGARRVRGFGGLAVDENVALLDEPLNRAA